LLHISMDYKSYTGHSGKLGEPFHVLTGVPQGSILSPVLLICWFRLNNAKGSWRAKKRDHIAANHTTRRPQNYADDIHLVSPRKDNMQTKLANLA
jgi:hypothetical protein